MAKADIKELKFDRSAVRPASFGLAEKMWGGSWFSSWFERLRAKRFRIYTFRACGVGIKMGLLSFVAFVMFLVA